MQIKYVTEFSWDAKVIGEVIIENEEHIAPGFLKMNSKMYPKNWVLKKMFNENDGEIIIRGEKNILKYNLKDKEYWLINIDEYFNKEKKDTFSQNSVSRSLLFSTLFESLIDTIFDEFIIQREKASQLENINGFRANKWITTIQSSKQKLLFEEWFVKELSLKDTLDSLKFDIMESLNPNKDKNIRTSYMISSDDFVWSADSTAVLDSLEGRIVQAKIHFEHEFFKSMSFEIKELYTNSFDAASFTIPEAYEKIEKK